MADTSSNDNLDKLSTAGPNKNEDRLMPGGSLCCPNHHEAMNRAARRKADRWCACRGECGWHV